MLTRLEKKEEPTSQWTTQKVTMIVLQERKGKKGQEEEKKEPNYRNKRPISKPLKYDK